MVFEKEGKKFFNFTSKILYSDDNLKRIEIQWYRTKHSLCKAEEMIYDICFSSWSKGIVIKFFEKATNNSVFCYQIRVSKN